MTRPVTVGVAFDAPGDERDALRDEQGSGAVLHHFACALERAERALEIAPRVARHMQARSELVRGERRARRVQRLEDSAGVRSFVALCAIASAERGSFGFFL